MTDGGAWDFAKLLLAAGLAAGGTYLVRLAIPRRFLRTALMADAKGALRFTDAHLSQFDDAARRAKDLEEAIARGERAGFDRITKLCEGWLVTAPSSDLLGSAARLEPDEADAVMKYLHHWNVLVGLEGRYRAALDRLLESLPGDDGSPKVARDVLREYAVRVHENACELGRVARVLQAQAKHFHDGRIVALTPDEETKARRASPFG